MAYLVAAGGHRKEITPSGDLVGSAEHAQVRVSADLGLVGEHYRVGLTEGGWQLQPLAPTLVNGTEVTSLTLLSAGDKITAGGLVLEFEDDSAEQTGDAPETLAVEPPAETDPLLGAINAARSAPKKGKTRRFPKFALPAAAAILLLGGGAFAAWKSGLLPFGKGDPHFALLAEYAPAGSDFAVSLDIQDIGKFYDHWRPKLGASLPSLADASAKMKAENGVGIEDFERVSVVGSTEALSALGASSSKELKSGAVLILTLAEGVDVQNLLDSDLRGVTKKDSGKEFSLYHSPGVKGMAARLVDGRHIVFAPVDDHMNPNGSMSAKQHIKALKKSDQTLVVSGAIPADKLKQLPGGAILPTGVSLGIDLPAGIDVAMALHFADKDDALEAEDEFEKLRGMAGMFAPSGDEGDMVKSVLSRLQIERSGSTQTISLSFGETELALLAQKSVKEMTARANTNKAKRNAQNLASVYSSSKAAGSPVWQTVTSKREIADALRGGVPGGESFASTTFQVPNLSDEDLNAALQHLNGQFNYFPMDLPGSGGSSMLSGVMDGLLSKGIMFGPGATDAKAKRNAQNVVSVYSAAVAAGSPELSEITDAEAGARMVVKGVKGSKEAGFDTTLFQASLTEGDLEGALEHITWDAERNGLSYTPKD